MSKIKILPSIALSFFLISASYAGSMDINRVTQSIEKLEKHLDMIAKRFGGKLNAEEDATKKQIAVLQKALEDAKKQDKGSSAPNNAKISALEQRLLKIQQRFGIGGLKGEENALKAQIKNAH